VEDSFGNRTAQSFTNGVYSNWANYNPANNQITTASSALAGYVYDASGNTLYDGNNRYWYDAKGQLCAVQSLAVAGLPITQYVYDAEGARIAKGTLSAAPASYTATCAPPLSFGFTITTRYLVDLGGDQVTELSEQSGEVWKHSNVFSAARLTATYDTGGLHYELADPLGTKRVQANISGQIETSWASLPFGDALTPILPPNPPSTADDATEHHFTQKERDNESGNDYLGARYYASSMGRFMSPDDFWKDTNLSDPQSWNKYAYARNNPLRFIDPTGTTATEKKTCSQDGKSCNIQITASIAIYADPKSRIDTAAAAKTIKGNIEAAWKGDFKGDDGIKYTVSTHVDVQVVDNKAAGEASGAQNVIELVKGSSNASANEDSTIKQNVANPGQDLGTWNIYHLDRDVAHEFTHILGVWDRNTQSPQDRILSNTFWNLRPNRYVAKPTDLRLGIQEVTGSNSPNEATVGVPDHASGWK
jgi:RHS repeat-associated protein